MWSYALFLASILAFTAGCHAGQHNTFYVSTDGNDAWSGRLAEPNAERTDGPFAGLAAARDAVRQLKAQEGLHRPIEILLRGGVYRLSKPLVLQPVDSGAEQCPITYAAYPGERPVLSGGVPVNNWTESRDGIYRADLKELGLGGARFHQLLYKGQRQPLARYPNLAPDHPRTGGFLLAQGPGPDLRKGFVYFKGDLPLDQWDDLSQAEVSGRPNKGWNYALAPIENIDTERRIVTTPKIRVVWRPGNRYFIQNVFDALDAPGEWFLDYDTSILYFYPPEGAIADGDVVVPVADHLVVLKGSLRYPFGYLDSHYDGTRDEYQMTDDEAAVPNAPIEYVNFRRLHFEAAAHDGLRMTGCKSCNVVGCTLRNLGGVAINLGGVIPGHTEVGNPRSSEPEGFWGGVRGGGQNFYFNSPCHNCRIAGCDVSAIGSDGIFLYGDHNLAENNHVYDVGRYDKDCPCINVWGENSTARRNTLHDTPRCAIFLKGVDNLIELNHIDHAVYESRDNGGIRMCQRNTALRGNVIRHNEVFNTIGYEHHGGTGRYTWPWFSWGIYLDDWTFGTTVYGNIVHNAGRGGIMLHIAGDNIVENNVVVDAGEYGVEIAPKPQEGGNNRVIRNILVCDGDDALVHRCTRWWEDLVQFRDNLVWPRGGPARSQLGNRLVETWNEWIERDNVEGSKLADPQFIAPEHDDFRLTGDSPAWDLGFERIPVEEIGCYDSPERAEWPLAVDPNLVQEKPVEYEMPHRPIEQDFEPDTMAPWATVRDYPKAPIKVTDKVAASGTRSLMIRDNAGLPNPWNPNMYWPLRYHEGTVQFSIDIRLDGQKPPHVMLDFRQYTGTGPIEYFTGPYFRISQSGELRAGSETIAQLPMDEWFTLSLQMPLGEDAQDSYTVTLELPQQEPQQFNVSHQNPDFNFLERIVIASLTDEESIFYIDNVSCDLVED